MKHSVTYPFLKYVYPDGTTRESRDIPVRIINPHTKKCCDTWAKLDTGADACVLPKAISDGLGHNFSGDGVKSEITLGVGGQTATCKHTFFIEIYDETRKKIVWSSGEMLIDCIDTNGLPPLIGVKDFLEHFEVKINYPNKTITLSWN